MQRRALARLATALAVASLLSACTSWRAVGTFPRWTLYAEESGHVDVEAFRRAYEPAFAAVEATFGPFRWPVRVHAADPASGTREGDVGAVHDVPGIGRARVRAFHARGETPFGPSGGVYASAPDPGTAVHELVHARLAELEPDLPLWFEEGLAGLMGDGFLDGGHWIVDGLACWPMRELRERTPDAAEIARLFALSAEQEPDLRDNVLVHFVGWAVVFDLYRESGALEWRAWLPRARAMTVAEARERLLCAIAPETERAWLARLDTQGRGLRMATAKGLWKLRSELVLPALIERLSREDDPEVQVALAINALAAAGERPPSGRLAGRMWRNVWPVLHRAELADAGEQRALEKLSESFRWRTGAKPDEPLETLRRFWAE